jgi:hypothetical protein
MAGTIIVDRIESDASYASSINVAAQVTFSNTVSFSSAATLSGNVTTTGTIKSTGRGVLENYDYQVPTTGFSYTFSTYNVLIMNPAGTLATGTITMPANPADGMTVTFSSTQQITALTVSPNTGQTINNALTTFGAGQAQSYIYRAASTAWFPSSMVLSATAINNALYYSVDYLVVAGGGSGGGYASGGGGAGGYLSSNGVSFTIGTAYSVTVGAGGATPTAPQTAGNNGTNSVLGSLATAIGGGGGAAGGGAQGVATSGGSGGGGASTSGQGTGGSGTAGQGNAGGNGGGGDGSGAGGGGAGAAGATVTSSSTVGGIGLQWLNGTYYAGGAGGSGGTAAVGGLGGGGTGSIINVQGNYVSGGSAGGTNTGGGSGGGRVGNTTGFNGGSGIVIIRYSGSQRGTGGTVTSSGGYTYHTFTSSGTYTA